MCTVFDEMFIIANVDNGGQDKMENIEILSITRHIDSHDEQDSSGNREIVSFSPHNITETECVHHVRNYTQYNQFSVFCDAMIFPESNLIAMIPAKAGSSTFRFAILKRFTKYIPRNRSTMHIKKAMNKNHQISSICDMNIPFNTSTLPIYINHTIAYFCNDNYEKFMIIRDPLTRILSGYLDKCNEHYDNIKNKTWGHRYWHDPCSPYLKSVGIDIDYYRIRKNRAKYEQSQMEYRKRLNENNTFYAFLKWLKKQPVQTGINNHFKNLHYFGDMEYFKSNWRIFDLHDITGWDGMVHQLLQHDEAFYSVWERIKKELKMDSYETQEHTEVYNKQPKENETQIWMDHHTTHSSQKVLLYYNDTQVLQTALEYVWKDYYVLDIELPQWICQIFNKEILTQLLVNKFSDKPNLLPNCLFQS